MSAPWWGCIGVSVRRRKSGDRWSRVVTRSVREGLLGPAFWALSVRMVTSALGGMALCLGVSGCTVAVIVGRAGPLKGAGLGLGCV